MLVELSVMEQRYQAVLAVVQDGWKVTEVAARLGVSRQSVHAWIARYEAGGFAALADRSHRPTACPQIDPETEAHICELRREHPGWDRDGSVTSSRSSAWLSSPSGRPPAACARPKYAYIVAPARARPDVFGKREGRRTGVEVAGALVSGSGFAGARAVHGEP